jgi:hypothetical protein
MMISSQELQDPAYRATFLNHKWAGAKSPLTFLFRSVELYAKLWINLMIFRGKIVDENPGLFLSKKQSIRDVI